VQTALSHPVVPSVTPHSQNQPDAHGPCGPADWGQDAMLTGLWGPSLQSHCFSMCTFLSLVSPPPHGPESHFPLPEVQAQAGRVPFHPPTSAVTSGSPAPFSCPWFGSSSSHQGFLLEQPLNHHPCLVSLPTEPPCSLQLERHVKSRVLTGSLPARVLPWPLG
jgi:hypothetical protein